MKPSKWTLKEQARFLKELGELLEQGYSLSHALLFLKINKEKKKEKDLVYALQLLKEGAPFYEVLSSLKFQQGLVSHVFFSEQHGRQSTALKEAGDFWLQRCQETDKLKKLLSYPIFLFVIVTLVFTAFERILLPKFRTLFTSLSPGGSSYLDVVLSFSRFLHRLPYGLACMAAGLGLLYIFWFKKLSPLKKMSVKLRIPFAGRFIRSFSTQFFASQLSGLLTAGLSINESFALFSQSRQQPFYQTLCGLIQRQLTDGKSLESILEGLPYFDKNLAFIVANGQKYGRLDQELYHYSRKLLLSLEDKIEHYLRIVQPALFSFVGLLIVCIYMAVLLPMYSLINSM
ncbi:competence type IV pilus assembly protein ComGB [Peribacillus kribbensis]|uniref:competence type IV pilus assembly protein ComGB n=1 Tax=Peribacillus kribbensis TaxID=356658 RepID=UPI0003F99ABD|nr:competence type IV pilus assembly protein ComGB [Peribacillus kribbensis]